jgi:hypothetical protein
MPPARFDREFYPRSPPNATISVLSNEGDTVEDAMVVPRSPKLDGDTLTFDFDVLEGEMKDASGPAALFIDRFAAHVRGPHGGHATVVGGRPAWRGAWYRRPGVAFGAGVDVGAAAAHPYYYGSSTCGYYPYPPLPNLLAEPWPAASRLSRGGLLWPKCGRELMR